MSGSFVGVIRTHSGQAALDNPTLSVKVDVAKYCAAV